MLHRANPCLALCIAVLLAACGDTNRPPSAYPGSFALNEDSAFSGFVYGTDAETPILQYFLATSPAHGQVTIDQVSGAFHYAPAADFHGTDAFQFHTWDGKAYSKTATVQVTVHSVNDAPEAASVAAQQNSAYTLHTLLPLPIRDVDGDVLSIAAVSSDPNIAQVTADAESVIITPMGRGATTIRISASDGQYEAETEFNFVVGDVTRHAVVLSDDDTPRLITLRNDADRYATFTLTYNGNKAFASAADAAEHVHNMTPQIEGETFPRKLWRYVRDNTYHNVPLGGGINNMWDTMWVTLNSLGWGFCSNVAAVFVEIAKSAGYEARVWNLYGHAVAEILVDGRWEMYDPDLAGYYLDREGRIAGVEQLSQDPALITSPIDPVLPSLAVVGSGLYSAYYAETYATPADNIAYSIDVHSREPVGSTLITLPPNSELVFPGHWTLNPIGYDGSIPYLVPEYRQAALRLPAGWTGSLSMPWLLWDVQGTGSIRTGGEDHLAGDSDFVAFLRTPDSAITDVEITSNPGGLSLIFLINATWYDILPRNDVSIHGQDVWAVTIGERPITLGASPDAFPDHLRKPVDVR